MKVRRVLLAVHGLPDGGPNLASVLRLAVGMSSAYVHHEVQVVLHGEGVLCGLRQANGPWVSRYLKAASAHGIALFADRESLTRRGFGPEELSPALTLLEPADYLQKWSDCELHIRM